MTGHPATGGAAAAPLLPVALLGRCPRCGRGPLFSGLLTVREACPACGLDLKAHDSGDGPAMAGIFVVGAVVVVAALVTDVKYEPPLWVHAAIWPVVILALSVGVMRVAKAALVALQYRHRRDGGTGG